MKRLPMPRMLMLLITLAISGCSALSVISNLTDMVLGNPPKTALRQITVSTDIAANSGSATMLDIVFVYDTNAIAQLPKTGPAWFQQKNALQNMLASNIEVVSLQIPAASPDFSVDMPDRSKKAVGVYVFANYLSEEGQAIANLTLWKQAKIHLLPKTIAYSGT